MRPVTKDDPGVAYPYTVDVSSQANLEASLKRINVLFTNDDAAENVKEVFGTVMPNAFQVLDGLLKITTKDPSAEPAKKKKKQALTVGNIKGTLDNKLKTAYYDKAAGPLEGQLGRFCSYCEIYQPSGVHVEHIAPKALYPLFYIAWYNFLLSCTVCNGLKKGPPREAPMFTPEPADEVGYLETIRATYLWPQWKTNVYQLTKPRLEWHSNEKGWQPVTYPVNRQTEIKKQDQASRTILADVKTDVETDTGTEAKWQFDVKVRVSVVPDGSLAETMVKLVNLNKPSYSAAKPGGEADIRMWERTLRWFEVLDSMFDLEDADAATFPGLWKMMMKSVQQPGLYSVWVTVIDLLGPGGSWKVPGTDTPVMTKFLTEIVGANYFPGTDTDDTPLHSAFSRR